MLNRIAQSLFWIGRYTERAGNHVRLIDTHYHIRRECQPSGWEQTWRRLVDSLGSRNEMQTQFRSFNESDALHFILLDPNYPNSLLTCVVQARSNLRGVRERLPSELWDSVNSFYLWLKNIRVEDVLKDTPHSFFRKVKDWAALVQGIEQTGMLRGQEWHFIEAGRHFERAENTLRILKSAHDAWLEDRSLPYLYLLSVLKSVGGYDAFRRCFADTFDLPSIAGFLLANDQFPYSVLFSFAALDEHLGALRDLAGSSNTKQGVTEGSVQRLIADLARFEYEGTEVQNTGVILEQLLQGCGQLGLLVEKLFFRAGQEATA